MTTTLDEISWPAASARDALDELLEQSRLAFRASPERSSWDRSDLTAAVPAHALARGTRADPVALTFATLLDIIAHAPPMLIYLSATVQPRVIAIVGKRRGRLLVIGPSAKLHKLTPAEVEHRILSEIPEDPAQGPKALAAKLGLVGVLGERVATAVARDSRAQVEIGTAWPLRAAPQEAMVDQLRSIGFFRKTAILALISALTASTLLAAFLSFGSDVLRGRAEPSQVIPWALLILTAIPLQVVSMWMQSMLLMECGSLLKRRLLEGSLRISPDRLRHAGLGTLLGKVNEAEAFEQASLTSAFGFFEGFASLGVSAFVLWHGPAPGLHVALLFVWAVAIVVVGVIRLQRTRRWSNDRITMSNDLVEKMVGHRTRVIQQQPIHWHDGEDAALYDYARHTRELDSTTVLLQLLPAAWMLAGFSCLIPGMLGPVDAMTLTIGIAGLIVSTQAMVKLGLATLTTNRLLIAWREISELFRAGYAPTTKLPEHLVRRGEAEGGTILDLADVRVSYPRSGRAALRGASGQIQDGDRILLQGPSGGGKSTLASVITGVRPVDGGVALLEGLDVHTLDATYWRKIVAGAPQFHENHVFSGTLAFNVLLGRNWPPRDSDLEEARKILDELGLGPLVQRMPLGLSQQVGAQGWQLSHGERSRIFVARALMQGARLIVLDESFGALDPHTLVDCMAAVLKRTRTLIVIAHP